MIIGQLARRASGGGVGPDPGAGLLDAPPVRRPGRTPDLVDRVLGRFLDRVGPVVEDVAMDATRMELSNAGTEYPARRGARTRGT